MFPSRTETYFKRGMRLMEDYTSTYLCINILFLQEYGRNPKNEMKFKKEKKNPSGESDYQC